MVNTYDYDFLVIGGGSGGVRAARIAANLGARVAIVEDTHWGGTCVNVGCVPKKIYHYAASSVDDIHIAQALGFDVTLNGFDWPRFFANKEKEIQRLQGIYARLLIQAGVEVIDGRGQLVDAHTVRVGQQHISARYILLAVGGQPVVPDILGAEHALTSDAFFAMDTLPESMLVVGGGYIGCELASTLHKFGVDVELSARSEVLREFDADVAQFVDKQMCVEGLTIRKGIVPLSIVPVTEALDAEAGSNGYVVTFSDDSTRVFEQVLFATGRRPRFDDLGLEQTSVALITSGEHEGLIGVNEHYQTAEPSIYAVGDIVPGPDLTPVALAQGMYVARHLFAETPHTPPDLSRVPTTVFTHPQLATVGATEKQLQAESASYHVFESEFGMLRTSITDYPLRAYIKLLVDATTDEILGVHLAGPEVGEVLQGFAVCVQARMTKQQLDETIGIHPTYAEELVTMRVPSRSVNA